MRPVLRLCASLDGTTWRAVNPAASAKLGLSCLAVVVVDGSLEAAGNGVSRPDLSRTLASRALEPLGSPCIKDVPTWAFGAVSGADVTAFSARDDAAAVVVVFGLWVVLGKLLRSFPLWGGLDVQFFVWLPLQRAE